MNTKEVKELLEKIDIHYGTEYSTNKNLILEWQKELKKYDSDDVFRKLEEHLKSNFSNIPPKLYFLVKDLKTPKEKLNLNNLNIICTYCKSIVNVLDYDRHYERCMEIDYIARNVKKYLNQEVNISEYRLMSDDDIKKRFDKIANIIIKKGDNQKEKDCLIRYFEESSKNQE